MNIFQALGLPATHRKENKVTQLVKHYDEVTQKNKDNKRLAIQEKKDGVCTLVVVYKGNVGIFSRTGKPFTNVEKIQEHIKSLNLPDAVYMGELICNNVSLEQLSGAVNPNRTKPLPDDSISSNLILCLFDLVGIQSFISGKSTAPYQTRYAGLKNRIPTSECLKVLKYAEATSEEHIHKVLEEVVNCGEEGIVIIDLDANWEAGHKGYRKMKLVRGVDYDLRCIGYEEGTGKYTGKVANLVFQWKDGETIKCMLGKGWTHVMAEEMFNEIKHGHKDSPIGKIFQVYALEESSKGKLRLPKCGEQRHDKSKPDV